MPQPVSAREVLALDRTVKSQGVRIMDVLALGPFMMWVSEQRTLPTWARVTMYISGALTVYYNAQNYLALAEQKKRAGVS